MRCDAASNNPMEEFASPVRCVSGEAFGLEPQSLVRPLDHRLCRSDLVISTGRRGLHVNDNRVLDIDQVIEPVAELDALVGFRGPGRARVHWRDHLWRLALCVSAFLIEGRKELRDCARLALGCRPVNVAWSLAMITAGIGFDDACIARKARPPDKPCIHAGTDTVSNTWRKMSLSRNRPWRLTENVE